MAVYSDFQGWNNKQFTGRGEFALTFGNYDVKLTVPSDFVVGATGEIQNITTVLTAEQISRYRKAKYADKPLYIITPDEALENEAKKETGMPHYGGHGGKAAQRQN